MLNSIRIAPCYCQIIRSQIGHEELYFSEGILNLTHLYKRKAKRTLGFTEFGLIPLAGAFEDHQVPHERI